MSDRVISYSGAIPLDTELLLTNKNAYIALAKLSAAVLGTSNVINNATCIPTTPASLSVSVGPCEIYSLQNIDNTNYSDIAADINHQILKQGVNLDSTNLNINIPTTAGYSQNYLIQFGFSETDTGSTVLLYYNASNPSSPFSGPGGAGTANNTIRSNLVSIQAKPGVAALTGTQTTPTPDTGFIGGYVVTVANGQTQITSGNITPYASPNPSFINETLTQKISQTAANLLYAPIKKTSITTTTTTLTSNAFNSIVTATGSNAYSITLPSVISQGTQWIDFISLSTSNALITIIPASGTISGQLSIVIGTGDSLRLITDGTNWYIQNLTLQSCNFRVYLNSSQAIAVNTTTKVLFDTNNFDIGSSFDLVTNHRATPLYPGKYSVNTGITLSNVTNTGGMTSTIQKNGSPYSVQSIAINAVNATGTQISDSIAMNGSTDYIECYVNQATGGTRNLSNGSSQTYFEMIRLSLF